MTFFHQVPLDDVSGERHQLIVVPMDSDGDGVLDGVVSAQTHRLARRWTSMVAASVSWCLVSVRHRERPGRTTASM
jgi:hypothetical protein